MSIYMNAMKKILLEDCVVKRIGYTPFGHFLDIGESVVNITSS